MQFPRPRAEEGTGGPHRKPRQAGIVARDPRRSRLADRDRGRTRQQALPAALGSSPLPPASPCAPSALPCRPLSVRSPRPDPSFTNPPKCSAKPLFERGFLCVFNGLNIRAVEDQYNGSVLHKHESKQRNPGLLGRVSLFCQGCVDGLITRGDITRLQNPPFRLLL